MSHPCQPCGLLGAVWLRQCTREIACPFFAELARPDQTSGVRVIAAIALEQLRQLIVLPVGEDVGLSVWIVKSDDYPPCSFTSMAALSAVASGMMVGMDAAAGAVLTGIVGEVVGMDLRIDLGMIVLLSHPFYFILLRQSY